MTCWLTADQYFCFSGSFAILYKPLIKTSETMQIAAELENPLAYFFPSVIECPGVVCLTSNVNSDNKCRFFYLLNLRILFIIHIRDLQLIKVYFIRLDDALIIL